jgi:hypothetical protein
MNASIEVYNTKQKSVIWTNFITIVDIILIIIINFKNKMSFKLSAQ